MSVQVKVSRTSGLPARVTKEQKERLFQLKRQDWNRYLAERQRLLAESPEELTVVVSDLASLVEMLRGHGQCVVDVVDDTLMVEIYDDYRE